MTTRIFLIRHGVTNWNKARRYCGCIDVPLSKEGREQARRLREKLKGASFDRLYSSDRKRALQTAKIIFGKQNLSRVKGLREINFGVLEGMKHKDIIKKYGKTYEAWLKNPFKNNIPRAEPMPVFQKRVVGSIKKLSNLNHGKNIALVCHGGVIGVFVSSIKRSRNFWRYVPKATSVTLIEDKAGRMKIKQFNDSSHLE